MSKIGSYSISATTTSADLTDFAFGALPQAINGLLRRYWMNLPAVSAATCCASIIHHDVNHNEIWRSDTVKDHSTQAEGTSAAGTISEIPIVAGDHFHLEWSARPSGDDNLPTDDSGADVDTELKLFIEEG